MTVARGAVPRHERQRPVVLAAAVAALVVLGVVAAVTTPSTPHARRVPSAVVALAGESSAAYCSGFEHERGVISSTVAVANLAASPRVVEVATSNEKGQVSHRLVRIGVGKVAHLDPAHLLGGSVQAVAITAEGGGVAATEAIQSVNGTAVAPCATEAAPTWWLTGGSTSKGQSLVVSIFNPYATTAVVSVTLLTPAGVATPAAVQGLVLAPHALDDIAVREVAPDEPSVTTLVTATVGDVVVYGISRSTSGAASISLVPGAPALDRTMFFPLASSATTLSTSLVMAAPPGPGATATVRVWSPPECGRYCPAPFVVGVTGGATSMLVVAPTPRVPAGDRISAEVDASTGVVAVERSTSRDASGQYAPVDDPGLAGARELVLVDPVPSRFFEVGIVNPSRDAVTVELETVGRHGLFHVGTTITVQPDESTVLPASLISGVRRGVLVLVASGPIAAAGEVASMPTGSGILVGVPTR